MMKLKKGQHICKMPPYGVIEDVMFHSKNGDYLVGVIRASMDTILEYHRKNKKTGSPHCYASSPTSCEIFIYPKADQSYELCVRYFPPMQEV